MGWIDHEFFAENGYVVVKNVVEPEYCEAVNTAMFAFLGFDPSNPDDWYREPLRRGGMLEMYQHQALWNNRQHPNIHAAFAEIYQTEQLLVSIDRCNFNPPARADKPEYDHQGMIHWDIDPTKLSTTRFGVQGVLYLAETTAETGGFVCAPGHHKLLERWAATGEEIPGAPNPERPMVPKSREGVDLTPIVGSAGDLVIWNTRLMHGNGRNTSSAPRRAQYITMFPAERFTPEERADRVMRWQNRLNPDAAWAPGDPRGWEQKHGTTATLTPLGRKLLGADPW